MKDYITAKQRVNVPAPKKEKDILINLEEAEVALLHDVVSKSLQGAYSPYRRGHLTLISKKIELNLSRAKISRLIGAF